LGVRIRAITRKLPACLLLLALYGAPANCQSNVDDVKARLVGQPLYLRDAWMDDDLHFAADGQPEKKYRQGPFTEAGIDVTQVYLFKAKLHIRGQRMALMFEEDASKRVSIRTNEYSGDVSVEIEAPADGDFDKAVTVIFAPDLASLIPSLPLYWQYYAQKHFLDASGGKTPGPTPEATIRASNPNSGSLNHVGGAIKMPVVLHQDEPQFSSVARALKSSGKVLVYLWIGPDGKPSHLTIAKPAAIGLDEQALLAVSKYKFRPATKDGQPITVDLYVEVNFQIGR
jgi:TonB family protein